MRATPEAKIDNLAVQVASGLSILAAGKAAGVPETTARRLASDPSFAVRVSRHRQAIVGRTVGMLASASVKAVGKLIALLDDPDSEVVLKTARGVLADLVTLSSHFALAEQLRQLEAPADALLDG